MKICHCKKICCLLVLIDCNILTINVTGPPGALLFVKPEIALKSSL